MDDISSLDKTEVLIMDLKEYIKHFFDSAIFEFTRKPGFWTGVRALTELLGVLLVIYMVYIFFYQPEHDPQLSALCAANQPLLEGIHNGSLCVQWMDCKDVKPTTNMLFHDSNFTVGLPGGSSTGKP